MGRGGESGEDRVERGRKLWEDKGQEWEGMDGI